MLVDLIDKITGDRH